MAGILHIKDSYYFEVPSILWPRHYESKNELPDVWLRNDPEYQHWEAERLYDRLEALADARGQTLPAGRDEMIAAWEAWQHADHERFGKPFDAYLARNLPDIEKRYEAWKKKAGAYDRSFAEFVTETHPQDVWFAELMHDSSFASEWRAAVGESRDLDAFRREGSEFSAEKLDAYSDHLSGKILIPQPFGTLRNLYEPDSGFAISKFMIIEVVIALLLAAVFGWLARRVASGGAPRGRLWNLLEVILVYLRDNVARPAIGGHEADRFVPFLWTIFVFVLACNLFGMIPWLGAPTGTFSVTLALAFATFCCVVIFGMLKFGVIGFFKNQIPGMDLPWILAIIIKPLILAIELLGLVIKHSVLAIRLLANMVAGHLVLLAFMGLAFGIEAAVQHMSTPGWQWSIAAVVSIVAATIFSCLELFVAFLQAYIFTFLSALFIGAAVHHH